MTDVQLLLLYYANLYKQVFEMTPDERPQDDVINDDDAFDRWYRDYQRRIERELLQLKRARTNKQPQGNWVSTDQIFQGE